VSTGNGGADEPATVETVLYSKHVVLEAWRRVKANQGAAGVDESRLVTLSESSRTTCIGFGIGCLPAATCRLPCERSAYRKQEAENES